jgi:hypothetical protein
VIDAILALPLTLLPRRYWQSFDLPVLTAARFSGFVMLFIGFGIGIPGYFRYLGRLRGMAAASILEVSKLQVAGKLPETADVSAVPSVIYALAPISFALFSPLGLFATYVVVTSIVRLAAAYVEEPFGDPILTGLDALGRRVFGSHQARTHQAERARLEGTDEPDRRYSGDWAGLTGVDFVIVAARRKPEWHKGTFIITSDGWFTLGEPFDRPTPNGLRTIYPLSLQTTNEVVRKSVSYELPPLRPDRARKPETSKPPAES